MKKMKWLLLSCLVSLFAFQAYACTPPLPVNSQTLQLGKILESDAFKNAIATVIQSDPAVEIEDIDFSGGVNFNLSNGCSIMASITYSGPAHPGMCPQIESIGIESLCPED